MTRSEQIEAAKADITKAESLLRDARQRLVVAERATEEEWKLCLFYNGKLWIDSHWYGIDFRKANGLNHPQNVAHIHINVPNGACPIGGSQAARWDVRWVLFVNGVPNL